jgi:hypothetical protein
VSPKDQAKKYRERAKELRALAAKAKDPANKAELEHLAEQYERLGGKVDK